MQVQQRLVRNPSAGVILAAAVVFAAIFAVLAFYLARPAAVTGPSTGSPSVTTVHRQAPDAVERNAKLRATCDSSICNPNAGSGTIDASNFSENRWWDSITP
jgi:hypothetical protein